MSSKTNYIGNRVGLSDEIIARTAFVSSEFVEDTYMHRFSTIQSAIDWAYSKYGAITDGANAVIIKVAPGIYTEQIHSYVNYYIAGYATGWDTSTGRPPATLYNTGADAAHYPLRSADGDIAQIIGLNIQTEVDGIVGKLHAGFFTNCYFKNCHFIEATEAAYKGCVWAGCIFRGNTYSGFNLTGVGLGSYGWRSLNNCNLQGAPVFSSTHTAANTLSVNGCYLKGHYEIGGDWKFLVRGEGFHTHTEAARNVIGTTSDVTIHGGECVNGLHFTSAPNSLKILGVSFIGVEDNQIPVGEADITSAVIIPDVEYVNNIQHNGISGKIQITCPIKSVGGRAPNKYFSIQDAITSIVTKGTVDIWESFTGLAELILTENQDITIEGHKTYSLTFSADIVELGANESLVFYGLTDVTGGNIEINGNSAYVGFEECLTINAYITLTSGTGTYCLVYSSTLKGITGHPMITQNNLTSTIILGYSRVDGGVGHPAILTTVEADSGIKAKFSTIVHGDGAGNAPLVYTGLNKMDILIYNCALNAVWDPADYTNLIGSAGNTTDVNIDF